MIILNNIIAGRKVTERDTYPAHESLQQYAKRIGKTVEEAYAGWHGRIYPEFMVAGTPDRSERVLVGEGLILQTTSGLRLWPAQGPGLGLRCDQVRKLAEENGVRHG